LKKVGDLLTALGVVGFIAVILELIIGWGMIPQSVILWFIIGSFILLVIGLVIRNKNNEKANGKGIQQVGITMLVFGIALLGIMLAGMFSSDSQSVLSQFVNDRFFFIVVFGLAFLLSGIIIRSIGKSKETKSEKKD